MGKLKNKTYKHCSLPYPILDKKNNLFYWVFYDKERRNLLKKENLQYALENFTKMGLLYHYQANLYSNRKNERPIYRIMVGYCTSFVEVIRALYDYPDTFVIPKEYESEYSKQELAYLKQLQNYFHVIGLKDEKKSAELNTIIMKLNELVGTRKMLKRKRLEKRKEKLIEKERMQRYTNSKAEKFLHYQTIYEKKESVITSFLQEERDYRIYRGHNPHVGEFSFLLDSEGNYRAILEFISEEELKFRDLTEDMVDYKSSGFKNFKDYKNDLYQKFLEESKRYKENFNENSSISYVKFKLVEKIENNRTK